MKGKKEEEVNKKEEGEEKKESKKEKKRDFTTLPPLGIAGDCGGRLDPRYCPLVVLKHSHRHPFVLLWIHHT